jgi:hypothetical protein
VKLHSGVAVIRSHPDKAEDPLRISVMISHYVQTHMPLLILPLQADPGYTSSQAPFSLCLSLPLSLNQTTVSPWPLHHRLWSSLLTEILELSSYRQGVELSG